MNDGAVMRWEHLGKELLIKDFGHVLLEVSIIYPKEAPERYTKLKLREKIHVVDTNLESPSYLLPQCCITKSNNHKTLIVRAAGVTG